MSTAFTDDLAAGLTPVPAITAENRPTEIQQPSPTEWHPMNLSPIAKSYLSQNLCVLPALLAQKMPRLPGWKDFNSRLLTSDELQSWGEMDAICLVCGDVSGGLEMIDFDFQGEMLDEWRANVAAADPGLLDLLVVERSQSGGVHVCYRCEEMEGNMKLARRLRPAEGPEPMVIGNKSYKTKQDEQGWYATLCMIETRGDGGLFLCAPTPGYRLVQGDFEHLPVISIDQRGILLQSARSLDERPDPEPAAERSESTTYQSSTTALTPGDDYNTRADVPELLTQHGWTYVSNEGDNQRWRRPGKDTGMSATFHVGKRIFYNFSSAADVPTNKGLSPFGLFAALNHRGDCAAAASDLRRSGYGGLRPEDVDISGIFGRFNNSSGAESPPAAAIMTAGELLDLGLPMHDPVIEGLLRSGEIMNLIAPPKMGKSWLVLYLALCVATGRQFFGHEVIKGKVLLIDNELHKPTISQRLKFVVEKMDLKPDQYRDNLHLLPLRGDLADLHRLGERFQKIDRDTYKVIVIDAWYRILPAGTDENDNGGMANLYNILDKHAFRVDSAFILIHHSSKGSQSDKSVTDTGSGAGSMSRATDTHAILRQHTLDNVVVLEAVTRSFSPPEPVCLRRMFPLWEIAPDLDPTDLKRPKRKAKAKPEPKAQVPADPLVPAWTVGTFVDKFINRDPAEKRDVVALAHEAGITNRMCENLIRLGKLKGMIHISKKPKTTTVFLSTAPPPSEPYMTAR